MYLWGKPGLGQGEKKEKEEKEGEGRFYSTCPAAMMRNALFPLLVATVTAQTPSTPTECQVGGLPADAGVPGICSSLRALSQSGWMHS